MISAALIKGDHIRTQPGPFLALLLDLRDCAAARRRCLIGRHLRLDRAVHTRRHIFGGKKDVQLEIR